MHFGAYLTAQSHEMRAALWTPGSLIIITFAIYTLVCAL
jgi:glutathione S-transferase